MSRTNEGSTEAGVAEKIKSTAQNVVGAVKDQYEHLRESASEHFDQGRRKAREWSDDVEGYVQDQPVKSLLIAAAIGLVLGVLWKRR